MSDPLDIPALRAVAEKTREMSGACTSSAWRRVDGGQELSLASVALDQAADAIETLLDRLSSLALAFRIATAGDVSTLIAARCAADDGPLIDCPVCGAVDADRGARLSSYREALEAYATALDIADALIERGYGTDVPAKWRTAYRSAADARSALSPTQKETGRG
jgi:hypothetical protein